MRRPKTPMALSYQASGDTPGTKTPYVYLYIDPVAWQIRYIGKGRTARAYNHLRGHSHNTRLNAWLQQLDNLGLKPIIHVIKTLYAVELEQGLIRVALQNGHPLVNSQYTPISRGPREQFKRR
jgi:hypothetical protein